jgi:hypothetical protein
MWKSLTWMAGGVSLASVLHLLQGGWWLNDGLRVGATFVALLIVALFTPTFRIAAAFGIGVALGKAGILMLTGPGTIFPIVIAVGSLIITVAVLIGFGIGWIGRLLIQLVRTRRRSVA